MRVYQTTAKFKSHNGRIAICDSQSARYRQEIYSTRWLILCAMMHVMYNTAFTAADVVSKILTFYKQNTCNIE